MNKSNTKIIISIITWAYSDNIGYRRAAYMLLFEDSSQKSYLYRGQFKRHPVPEIKDPIRRAYNKPICWPLRS